MVAESGAGSPPGFFRRCMRHGDARLRTYARLAIVLCQRGYAFPQDVIQVAVMTEMQTAPGTPESLDAAHCAQLAELLIERQIVGAEPDRDQEAAQWERLAHDFERDPATFDLHAGGDADPHERKARQWRWAGMLNRAMRDRLERGECVDLSTCARTAQGDYIVPVDVWQEDMDYCNADTEEWIWSIGRSHADAQIIASHSNYLYLNPDYECLWLR
jgi:hypothetical protein